jgi:hypothetical protein
MKTSKIKSFGCMLFFIACLLIIQTSCSKVERETFIEDFEKGDGTNLPGWTITNGGQMNRWIVGTATAFNSEKSIYISNTSPNNTYDINTTSIVHFYRGFSFSGDSDNPSELSFHWKANGERGYDELKVYIVDLSVTPVGGSEISGVAPILTRSMGGSTTWTETKIILPALSGTKRLVFSWINDDSFGSQPPVAIDNIMITNVAK